MPPTLQQAIRLRSLIALLDARLLLLLSSGKPGRARQDEIVRLEDLRGMALRRLAERSASAPARRSGS